MIRRHSHIVSLLVLMLSASLCLSTVHVHESLEHQASTKTETGTSFSPDTAYCPICGYLLKAGNISSIQPVTALQAFDDLVIAEAPQHIAPSLAPANSRAPPFLA